jgi:alpha-glucoside transport system permease protein
MNSSKRISAHTGVAPRSTTARFLRFLGRIPLHLIILVIVLIWFIPVFALLISSFRPEHLIATTGWWQALAPPYNFNLDLYTSVLAKQGFYQSFVNSIFIAVPATVIPVLIASFAAYTFSWMKFPGRNIIFIIVVALIVVPLQMTLIPVLRIFNSVHLNGTLPGIWLAHTGYGLPFAIYLLRNFFGQLPREMLESAYLDGASSYTAFFRLVLPLSVPAIASLSIFQFMWVWNDLLVALIFLGSNPKLAPMTLTIANLVSSLGAGWQLLTAAAFLSIVVPLIIFFALQSYFVRGILAGSVKG